MGFGFQAINSSGYLQIDQDYTNYSVVAKGVWTYNGATQVSLAIPDYGVIPMIFCRNPTGFFIRLTGVLLASLGGGQNNAFFTCLDGAPAVGVGFEYMLCVPSALVGPPPATYGLRVHRSDGSTAFDSLQETPRIAAVFYGSLPAQRSVSAFYNFGPAHGNPWILMNGLTGATSIAIEGTTGFPISAGTRMWDSQTIQVAMIYPPWASPFSFMSGSYPAIPITSAVLANP